MNADFAMVVLVGAVAILATWFAREWSGGRHERHRLRRYLARAKARDALQAARVEGDARLMLLARCDAYDEIDEYVAKGRWRRAAEEPDG